MFSVYPPLLLDAHLRFKFIPEADEVGYLLESDRPRVSSVGHNGPPLPLLIVLYNFEELNKTALSFEERLATLLTLIKVPVANNDLKQLVKVKVTEFISIR